MNGMALPSETALRLMVQNVVDYAIFMLDPDGRVASWNAGAERIKGYRAEEIIGRHFSVFYPAEDIAADKPGRELRTAIEEGRLEDEGWRIRADGSRFWADVVITALFDETGTLQGFGKVARDMTERRRAERAVTEGRRLVAHLVEARELERRRIAWDVHDDPIQAMVAVGMRLRLLADRLPEEHTAALRTLDESVAGAVDRLRDLVLRLRPPAVDHEGLAAVLAGYLDDTALRYTLRYELAHEPPPETAITIFRICQEALTNVGKHAMASAVEVSVAEQRGGVLVRVVDDGVGLGSPSGSPSGSQPGSQSRHEHFGLLEMRERAETADGWWTIHGDPGQGTTVEFWLPAAP